MRPQSVIHYILAFLMLSFTLNAKTKHTVEQLFNVQTVKVKQEQVASSKKSYGYVVADESRTYDVVPRFGGYVTKLYITKTYQKVAKGDPLVQVYSPEVSKAKDEYLNSYHYSKERTDRGML